jgi:hypothetical protein
MIKRDGSRSDAAREILKRLGDVSPDAVNLELKKQGLEPFKKSNIYSMKKQLRENGELGSSGSPAAVDLIDNTEKEEGNVKEEMLPPRAMPGNNGPVVAKNEEDVSTDILAIIRTVKAAVKSVGGYQKLIEIATALND